MAIYDNSIDRYPFAAGPPADFTLVSSLNSSVAIVQDSTPQVTNRVFKNTAGSTVTSNYQWTFPPSTATDCEALALGKVTDTVIAGTPPGTTTTQCWIRKDLAITTNTGYGFRLVFDTAGAGGLSVRLVEADTAVSCAAFTWVVGTWYWMRVRAIGTSISGSIWALGSTEPSPQLTATSAVYTNGAFALRFQAAETGLVNNYAWLSAATGTDIAPGPGYAAIHTTERSNDGIGILPDAMKGY